MRTTSLLCISVLLLAACSDDPQKVARIQELQKNPEISLVGEFDGCTVKYVNRYYQDQSFYLARCGDTSTMTRNFSEQQGKVRVTRTRTVITKEIADLQAEAASLEAREKAIAKLTPDERAGLGVTKD